MRSGERACPTCGAGITRKRYGRRLEDAAVFKARIFCSKRCRRVKKPKRYKFTCKQCTHVGYHDERGRKFCDRRCYTAHKRGVPPVKPRSSAIKPTRITKTEGKLCPCGIIFQIRPDETRTYHSNACLLAHL